LMLAPSTPEPAPLAPASVCLNCALYSDWLAAAEPDVEVVSGGVSPKRMPAQAVDPSGAAASLWIAPPGWLPGSSAGPSAPTVVPLGSTEPFLAFHVTPVALAGTGGARGEVVASTGTLVVPGDRRTSVTPTWTSSRWSCACPIARATATLPALRWRAR